MTNVERSPAQVSGARDRTRAAQRNAIEAAALELLDEGGPEAVTTRAVSARAGVQPMTIYRIFGDMDRLLDSAASRGFEEYVATKRARPSLADPLDDLRAGWDLHVDFGLSHPYVYAHTYGKNRPGVQTPAVQAAAHILEGLVERVAQSGRLLRGVTSTAQIIHSAGCGVVMTLMQIPPHERDMTVSASVREAVLSSLTTDAVPVLEGTAPHAVALRSSLQTPDERFTNAELGLLREWLDRLS